MIYEFLKKTPDIHNSAYIAPSADIIGDVSIGPQSSVWFNTTIRGDVNWIKIGQRTNIQDNVCIHVMNQTGPTRIGDDVTVGHGAIIHGCTIHERVLIGMNAVVLDQAIIQPEVIVAAGTLVPPGKTLQSGHLYMGSPARAVRPLSSQEIESISQSARNYIKYMRAYQEKDTYAKNPFYTAAD